MHVADLKKKLQDAEERAADATHAEALRQLEHQKQAAAVEIKLLHEELRVRLLRSHTSPFSTTPGMLMLMRS